MSSTLTAPAPGAALSDLPRVRPFRFIGNVRRGGRGDFNPWLELGERYPHGFESRIFGKRCIVVTEPDIVETVIVKNHKHFHRINNSPLKYIVGDSVLTLSGEAHLRQRRLIQPAFHKDRIDAYGATMVSMGERLMERWKDGENLDLHAEMMEVTAAVITKTMFSTELEEDARVVAESIDTLVTFGRRYAIPRLARVLNALPLKSTRKMQAALAQLDAIVHRFIEEHRSADEDMGDLLSMLMAVRYDDGSAMTDQQLRDESMTLFLAGHETTATALSWAFYLLTQHPEIAAKLREEVDAVLESGRAPTVADLPRLDYTYRVLTESMRIYPPVPMFGRQAVDTVEIEGLTIDPGTIMLISPLLVHRDARWFPEPEQFDPDRWLPECAEALPKWAYFPFGGGPRRCIGERFAWMEGTLLLALFSRHWNFDLVADAIIAPKMSITLRPMHGVPVTARKRP